MLKESTVDANARETNIERPISIDLTRSGGEKRLIEPQAHRQDGITAQHETLLASIARGRRWYDDLTNGRAINIAEIARRDGVTDALIHHALQCALVPAEQIQRLLEGRAGIDLCRAMALRGFGG